MKFDIKSYESVGPLEWGMSIKDVRLKLGDASRSIKNAYGNTIEYRDNLSMSCIFDKDSDSLVEITFYKKAGIFFFRDLDLIATPSRIVVDNLFLLDNSAVSDYGSIVFPILGIALTGYAPEDKEIRAAGAFARGRWDRSISEMKPFQPKRRPQKS